MGCKVSSLDDSQQIKACCEKINNRTYSLDETKAAILQISNRDRSVWPWDSGSPLSCAIRANRRDLVRFMIHEAQISPYSQCDSLIDDTSALCVAIQRENEEMIRFLVNECRVDVNHVAKRIPQTAIIQALRVGNERLVKLLVNDLKSSVNIDFTDEHGNKPYTALHYAIMLDVKDIISEGSSDLPLTQLILDLGGDTRFVTYASWQNGKETNKRTISFGKGDQPGTAAELLRTAIKNIPFKPQRPEWEEQFKKLIWLLESRT